MEFGDPLRTTGRALKNWLIAQALDSLAVGILWLVGLYVLHVPWAPLWALLAAVLQIVPHFGPILALVGAAIAATIGWRDWQHPIGVLILYAIVVVLEWFSAAAIPDAQECQSPHLGVDSCPDRARNCLAVLGHTRGAAFAGCSLCVQASAGKRDSAGLRAGECRK